MAIPSRLALWRKAYGPDLAEFSLIAGVIAVSVWVAMPSAATILSKILKVASTHQGS
jgi:hypothetical protein